MESPNRVDLGKLSHLAYKGRLFQAWDEASSTGLVNVGFALWNPGTSGIPIRVISLRVSSDTARTIYLDGIAADPALARGNLPANLYLGGGAPQAFNEAAQTVVPAPTQQLGGFAIEAGQFQELVLPGSIFIPPQYGLLLWASAIASQFDVIWLWAELPPPDQDN